MLNPHERRTAFSTLVTRVLPLLACLLLLLNLRHFAAWQNGGGGGGATAAAAAAGPLAATDDGMLPQVEHLRAEVAKLKAAQAQLQAAAQQQQPPPTATDGAGAAAAAAAATAAAAAAPDDAWAAVAAATEATIGAEAAKAHNDPHHEAALRLAKLAALLLPSQRHDVVLRAYADAAAARKHERGAGTGAGTGAGGAATAPAVPSAETRSLLLGYLRYNKAEGMGRPVVGAELEGLVRELEEGHAASAAAAAAATNTPATTAAAAAAAAAAAGDAAAATAAPPHNAAASEQPQAATAATVAPKTTTTTTKKKKKQQRELTLRYEKKGVIKRKRVRLPHMPLLRAFNEDFRVRVVTTSHSGAGTTTVSNNNNNNNNNSPGGGGGGDPAADADAGGGGGEKWSQCPMAFVPKAALGAAPAKAGDMGWALGAGPSDGRLTVTMGDGVTVAQATWTHAPVAAKAKATREIVVTRTAEVRLLARD